MARTETFSISVEKRFLGTMSLFFRTPQRRKNILLLTTKVCSQRLVSEVCRHFLTQQEMATWPQKRRKPFFYDFDRLSPLEKTFVSHTSTSQRRAAPATPPRKQNGKSGRRIGSKRAKTVTEPESEKVRVQTPRSVQGAWKPSPPECQHGPYDIPSALEADGAQAWSA